MNDPLLLVTYHGVVHPQVDHSAQATRNLVGIYFWKEYDIKIKIFTKIYSS